MTKIDSTARAPSTSLCTIAYRSEQKLNEVQLKTLSVITAANTTEAQASSSIPTIQYVVGAQV